MGMNNVYAALYMRFPFKLAKLNRNYLTFILLFKLVYSIVITTNIDLLTLVSSFLMATAILILDVYRNQTS